MMHDGESCTQSAFSSPVSVPPLFFSSIVPPNLTVPRGKSPLVVREGETVELECLVSGKPKPIILWSRADKEVPMPDGSMQMESYDGVLRIINVSREMSGSYRCQTSQYNGFNVKPREALVELIVQCKCPDFKVFHFEGDLLWRHTTNELCCVIG